jgi:hypothetical protein
MHPHRMRRIGQPAVRKRIARKQVAVLVVIARQWNAGDRNHRRSNHEQREANEENAEVLS